MLFCNSVRPSVPVSPWLSLKNQLRPFAPWIADPDTLSGIHVAILAKGFAFGDEATILRNFLTTTLASYTV
jgi:hypothetical protein